MGTPENPTNRNTSEKKQLHIPDYQDALVKGEAHEIIGPNNVLLQVNYGCYLRCQMCNRWKWTEDGASRDSEMQGLELDSLFDQLALNGTRKVTLVGTEPVVRPDLPDILTAIRARNIKPELYTAGIKLTDKVIGAVLENSVDVSFSIDGFFSESHNAIRWPVGTLDAFSMTQSSVHRLKEARDKKGITKNDVRLAANMTLQDKNIKDLETATPSDIDALGVDMLRISLVHGLNEDGSVEDYCLTQKDMETIRNFVRRFRDPANKASTKINYSAGITYIMNNMISGDDFDQNILIPSGVKDGTHSVRCTISEWSTMIDPEGNVYPCLYLLGDNSPFQDNTRNKYIMGNVKKQSFSEVWRGERYQNFRESHFPNLDKGSRCWTCEYMDKFDDMNYAEQHGKTTDGSTTLEIGW